METSSETRIAAVFACYNRRTAALACVEHLRRQTRQPDLVVVADNHSSDDTREALAALEWKNLTILDTGANLGNAGGVEAAMEHAFSLGADAVWILDDDSWPRTDALEHLASGCWDDSIVRIPLQIDPSSGNFTWPLQVPGVDGGWTLAESYSDLPAGEFFPTRNNWTGALISKKVRNDIGPVMGALFIRGEDEEYPWRMEQAGYCQEVARGAVLDHPGPAIIRKWRFLGKNLFFEPGLADWKLYYKVRNMVWLKRNQRGSAHSLAIALAYLAAIARFDSIARWPLAIKAALAGWHGCLGKWTGH